LCLPQAKRAGKSGTDLAAPVALQEKSADSRWFFAAAIIQYFRGETMRYWIRRLTSLTLNCLLLCAAVYAQGSNVQSQNKESRGHGYAFFAPSGVSDSSRAWGHVGAGFEGVFGNGAGVGAEIGYVTPLRRWDSGLGLFSLNGAYHFKNSSKVVPFVTGGYSGFFRSGYANGFNFGGGVNYWVKERVGLRFEFRDQVPGNTDAGHFYGVRFGVTFR
jgi:hypothetical protein